MRSKGEAKFPFLFICLGLGAIGGLMIALLARKETRDSLRESSTKTLDYLNQQGKKLRETTEGIVEKGKELVSRRCCSSDATTETQELAQQEDRREHFRG